MTGEEEEEGRRRVWSVRGEEVDKTSMIGAEIINLTVVLVS